MEVEFDKLLKSVLANKASDLQVHSGETPWLRINGEMRKMTVPSLTKEEVSGMINSVMPDAYRAKFGAGKDIDFVLDYEDPPQKGSRFRINAFHTTNGPALTIRALSPRMPELQDLNLPPAITKLANSDKGLLLVTGATGSGKSTSLAAIINHLNKTTSQHILTIEDPVEYRHVSQRSMLTHRELGTSVESYPEALRSALRQDPDVILIGEIRDVETAREALHAAETGHLVLATIHTGSAANAADRLINMFPENERGPARHTVAENLVGVLTQQLVKKADGKGRVAAAELLVATPAIRNMIRENKTAQISSAIQTGAKEGMIPLTRSLQKLEGDGVISKADYDAAMETYRREGGVSEGRGH